MAEQLSRGWMSVESLIARGSGLIGVLAGLPPQKEEDYLPRVARIVFPGAFLLSELSAGSNVANCSCLAARGGDEWVFSRGKYWYTLGMRPDEDRGYDPLIEAHRR